MRAVPLLMLAFACQLLSAQEKLLPILHFDRLTTDDGLPTDEIPANVVRDHQGFVWAGTKDGLVRFDGHACEVYRNDRPEPGVLASSHIMALHADERGFLWFGTMKSGLGLFDPSAGRFINLLSRKPGNSPPQAESVVIIHEDKSGNLWCGSMTGDVVHVDLSGVPYGTSPDSVAGRLRFRTIQGFKNTVWDFADWNDDTVLVASDNGLFLIDRATGNRNRPGIPPTSEIRLDTARVTSLCWETPDRLWLGSYSHGLYLYDRARGTLTAYHKRQARAGKRRDDDITFARFDSAGRFWVATRSGLDLFDPSSGLYREYLKAPSIPFGEVTFLYPDGQGILWVSTAANGLFFLSPRSFRLPHFGLKRSDTTPAEMESISEHADGTLWIRTEGKVIQVEPQTLTVLRTVDLYRGAKPTYGGWGSSHVDSRGRIWYATFGLGIYNFDPASGVVRNFRPSAQLPGLPFNMDACVSIAGNGGDSLWVAAYKDGLFQFDTRTNRFVDRSEISGKRLANVLDVAHDDGGNLWVSDQAFGLYRISPRNMSIDHFGYDSSQSHEFTDDELRGVFRAPRNAIWVSARTLSLWDQEHRTFRMFPNDRFREARFAAAGLSDRRGRLWVWYPGEGLGILDPSTGVFTNYDFSDGFGGGTDMAELRDARVAMVGNNGINVVDPDSLSRPLDAPPLVITRITVNDTIRLSPPSTDAATGVRLPHHQGVIEFEFAAIDPAGSHQVEYFYRLEGLEEEWVRANRRRFVRYPGLGPGEYVFNVRAVNALGRWADRELALAVVIDPPLWRTGWAYGAYAAVVLGLLLAARRAQQRQERLKRQAKMDHFQAQQLEEMDRLKSRFFANISHEFRTPLTLILGPARQLLEQSSDEPTRTKADLIHRSARKLNRLVDELLDLSKLEAGEMKLAARQVDVLSTVQNILLTFQPLAERKRVSSTCSCEEDAVVAYLDAEKADTILSNVLSNAFKFTPEGGRVDVRIATVRRGDLDYVEIAVADTGIGIPEDKVEKIFDRFYQVDGSHTREQEGTGIGLALTEELVKLHHGKIEVESQEGRGSTFRLLFPLGRAHLKPEEICEGGKEHPGPKAILPTDEVVGEVRDRTDGDAAQPQSVPTLLIVEDNPDVRKYIRLILEERYRIIEAGDGQEGFDKSLEFEPDLIISDIMMPKLDGFQLCARWKADTKTSHIPVIMLTAKATMNDKIAGLEVGADDYIMKPFEADELKARITNLIHQRKRLHEHYRTYGLVGIEEKKIAPADQKFLRRAADLVTEHLADTSFSVEAFAEQMAVSRSLLCRKLDALLGESPNELIKRIRLNKAAKLLEAKAGNVSEIALEVGFNSPSYFAECFRKQYGSTPTEFHHSRHKATPGPEGRMPK